MSATPEKIVAASKANVEAGLKSASAFVTTVFTAAERVAQTGFEFGVGRAERIHDPRVHTRVFLADHRTVVLVAEQLAQAEELLRHLGRAGALADHGLLDDMGEL